MVRDPAKPEEASPFWPCTNKPSGGRLPQNAARQRGFQDTRLAHIREFAQTLLPEIDAWNCCDLCCAWSAVFHNTSCELPLLPGVQLAASTVAVETICLGGALDSVWRLHKLRPRSGRQLCGCQGETGCWETDVLSSQRSDRKLAGKLLGASTLTLGCFPGFPVLATGVGMGEGGFVCVCGLRRAHGALTRALRVSRRVRRWMQVCCKLRPTGVGTACGLQISAELFVAVKQVGEAISGSPSCARFVHFWSSPAAAHIGFGNAPRCY